jgi:hypothetical protein
MVSCKKLFFFSINIKIYNSPHLRIQEKIITKPHSQTPCFKTHLFLLVETTLWFRNSSAES